MRPVVLRPTELNDPAATRRNGRTIRVLVADDHPPTRAGLRLTLERGRFVVVAEADDAPSAVEAALRERPDLCLIDIHMPGNGIRAIDEITAKLPETHVVVFTSSRDDTDFFDALRSGAVGYLFKDIDPDRLGHVLEAVLAGEAALPRRLVPRLLEEFRERGQRRRIPLADRAAVELTSREWEVLELMRKGLSTAEIGRRLFISPVTVRTHVASLLRKLDVPDRDAAIRLVSRR